MFLLRQKTSTEWVRWLAFESQIAASLLVALAAPKHSFVVVGAMGHLLEVFRADFQGMANRHLKGTDTLLGLCPDWPTVMDQGGLVRELDLEHIERRLAVARRQAVQESRLVRCVDGAGMASAGACHVR